MFLTHMAHIRTQNKSNEKYEQPTGFALLGPVPLPIRHHLILHLLEILLLLVAEMVGKFSGSLAFHFFFFTIDRTIISGYATPGNMGLNAAKYG